MIKALTLSHPDVTENASTYLRTDSTPSGGDSLEVGNASGLSVGDFIVVGLPGLETTEITQVLDADGEEEIVTSGMSFSHPAGTTITVIPYDTFRVYRSVTGEGGSYSLLASASLQIDQPKNIYRDSASQSPYSYKFSYYNTETDVESSFSSEIPFGGYPEWSLKMMQDSILSDFGDMEEKFIKRIDVTRWLNYFYLEVQVLLMGGESPYYIDYIDIVSTESSEYDLATYEMLGVFMMELSTDGGVTFGEPITPKDFRFRDASGDSSRYDYRMAGNKIYFTDRVVPAGNIMRIWYTTNPIPLVNPTDVLMNPMIPMLSLFHDYAMIRANEKDRKPELNYALEKRIKEAKAEGGIIYKLRKRIRQGNMIMASTSEDSFGGFING